MVNGSWLPWGMSHEPSTINLKGDAICRQPLHKLDRLASRDRHLGALVPPFWHSGSHFGTPEPPWGPILASREHIGRPFSHLGATLEDHGSSRMDTKLQITRFLTILEWFLDLFLSVFHAQNALKIVLFLGLFLCYLFSDFWLDFSTFGTSKSWLSHGRYCKKLTFRGNRF